MFHPAQDVDRLYVDLRSVSSASARYAHQ